MAAVKCAQSHPLPREGDLGSLSDSILHEGMGLVDRLGSSARIMADHKQQHFVHSNDMFVSCKSLVAAGGSDSGQ